ncbi:hypothetical protein AAVH_29100 [Aphelenchoides avenae]|nr:hypothetical protein AAVH_29100 [Aphelenchus avenae]
MVNVPRWQFLVDIINENPDVDAGEFWEVYNAAIRIYLGIVLFFLILSLVLQLWFLWIVWRAYKYTKAVREMGYADHHHHHHHEHGTAYVAAYPPYNPAPVHAYAQPGPPGYPAQQAQPHPQQSQGMYPQADPWATEKM